MSDNPVWRREGWAPSGPGFCRCPKCGARVSTNALARARHTCKPKPAPTHGAALHGHISYACKWPGCDRVWYAPPGSSKLCIEHGGRS